MLDYDDLLLYFAQMLAEGDIAADVAGRFDHLLVDEYQDTNRLQAEIVLALRPRGRGLTVVGDDAQSIYSFRAATVRNILDFPQSFDPPARVVTLERNYRSTRPILAAANAVIALAPERFAKNLWTERAAGLVPALVTVGEEADQARCVARPSAGKPRGGRDAEDRQAVLFRAAHHSAALELELTRRNIPFVKFGGLKFLDAAHIKDTLALLRFADEPARPRRRLSRRAIAARHRPGKRRKNRRRGGGGRRLRDAGAASRRRPRRARPSREFAALLARLARARRGRATSARRSPGGAPAWRRLTTTPPRARPISTRWSASPSTFASRERFLSELTLDPPDATSDEAGPPQRDEDYLILSTIHSAKGQEWKSVFVLNCVDGCIPSDLATGSSEEIEEERRLLYVAMTRARDELTLIVPQRFYVHGQPKNGDRHVYAGRTRFIPAPLLKHFDRRAWPRAAPSRRRARARGRRSTWRRACARCGGEARPFPLAGEGESRLANVAADHPGPSPCLSPLCGRGARGTALLLSPRLRGERQGEGRGEFPRCRQDV